MPSGQPTNGVSSELQTVPCALSQDLDVRICEFSFPNRSLEPALAQIQESLGERALVLTVETCASLPGL